MRADLCGIFDVDIPDLASAAKSFDMPRSERWFRRYFYENGFRVAADSGCRGYFVRREDASVGGYQCVIPCEVYWKQQQISSAQLAFMGIGRDVSGYIFDLLEAADGLIGDGFVYANSLSSQKPLRLLRDYLGFQEGPVVGEQSNYALCDNAADKITKTYEFREMIGFEERLFAPFWAEFLSKNDGLITSRRPEVLASLFNGSLRHGTMHLIAALSQQEQIRGYILFRKYPLDDGRYRYQTADWCAVGNDEECLTGLLLAARRYVFQHKAWKFEYNGAPPGGVFNIVKAILPETLHLKRQTFVYRCKNADINQSLSENATGWFFGPFDGDRCMGHGMYLDW